jgi:hypothetical protein
MNNNGNAPFFGQTGYVYCNVNLDTLPLNKIPCFAFPWEIHTCVFKKVSTTERDPIEVTNFVDTREVSELIPLTSHLQNLRP